MPELTRRRALLAAASGAVSLVGCVGSADRPTIDHAQNRSFDPRAEHVRVEELTLLFQEGERTPQPSRPRSYSATEFVATSDQLGSLTFADRPEASVLRQYAAETNFAEESVWLFSRPIDGCHEYRLQWVGYGAGEGVEAEFCRPRRPADVACETDTWHTVGYAIRLPIAGEGISSSSVGTSSDCNLSHGRYFNASVTPVNEGDDA